MIKEQKKIDELLELYHKGDSNNTLKKALALNKTYPNHITINSVIAISYRNLNMLHQSLEHFLFVAKLNPNSAEAYSNIGVVYNGLKRYDEAVKYYKKALTLDPNISSACSNLGNVLRELGQNEESIKYCKKAIELNPNFPEAYDNLGFVLKEIGELDEALINFNKAIEVNPNHANVYNNKASLLLSQDNYEEAINNCNIAIKLDENFIDPYFGLGTAYLYTGQYDKSLINYKHALSIDRDNLKVYIGLFELIAQTNSYINIKENINYFSSIKNVEDNMHGLILYAIHCYMVGELKTVKEILVKLKPFINHKSLASHDKVNKKFIIVYFNYLSLLLDFSDLNFKVNRDTSKIYHVGESHSLSFANKILQIGSESFSVKPLMVFGAKAFHLSKKANNKFKHFLENHLRNIPANSKVMFSFGEIDCRGEEGIIPYHLKSGISLKDIVLKTVTDYVEYMQELLSSYSLTPYFMGLPAPIKENEKSELMRIEVIQLFNKILKEELEKRSLNFIDIYSFTANESGSSNLKYMCDDYHLSPKATGKLELLINEYENKRTTMENSTTGYNEHVDYTYGYYKYRGQTPFRE